MISCGERDALREETLRSLSKTDWGESATVVLDQALFERRQDRQADTSLRALRAAIADGSEFILFLEDDLDFNNHLRHNLEHWPPFLDTPSRGYFFASLYNPNIEAIESRPADNCFIAHPERMYGSQAYLLSHSTACYVAEHWDEVMGMQDIKMSRLAGRVCTIHYHAPSLVEHTGRTSVWGGHFHSAVDFNGTWRANRVSPFDDRSFFQGFQQTSLDSARVVIPLLLKMIKPRRVVDVGCSGGSGGAWLRVLREAGIDDIWGIDGDSIDNDLLLIPPERVLRRDLTGDLRAGEAFDLAICLEVAQNLPAASSAGFVAALAELSKTILFSAAIPGQGGYRHVNEQWPEYWAERFAGRGFEPVDCIRRHIWNDSSVGFWYRQNTLLFVHETYLREHPELRNLGPAAPLSLVHPDLYLMKLK
jgi:hypothetical protein